jgi:hypothetical protein
MPSGAWQAAAGRRAAQDLGAGAGHTAGEGRDAKEELHEHAPLPLRRALKIARDIVEALAHLVPERVWAVVQRLCEKDPANRYPSAEALLVELNRLLRSFHELEGGDVF